jgi:hypothetical protein
MIKVVIVTGPEIEPATRAGERSAYRATEQDFTPAGGAESPDGGDLSNTEAHKLADTINERRARKAAQ